MRKERCKNRSKLLNKPSGHRVQIRSFVRCSLDQNQNLPWRQGLKCIKVAWLRARRETRRGSIFCSRSHRFHLVWKEFRKSLSRSWVWNLTFDILTHKFIQDLPPLLTIAGGCRNLSFPICTLLSAEKSMHVPNSLSPLSTTSPVRW